MQDKVFALAKQGVNDTLDSDVNNGNGFGTTSTIVLLSGTDNLNMDAGYIDENGIKSNIGDYVWVDRDNDGVQDGFESGKNGIEVELYDFNDVKIDGTITKNHPTLFSPGYYEFNDVIAGQYYLMFRIPGRPSVRCSILRIG